MATNLNDVWAAINNLVAQIGALATVVSTIAGTQTIGGISSTKIIEKPVAYKGKSSEQARIFHHAFQIWAKQNEKEFALRNNNGNIIRTEEGAIVPDECKMITSALSFLTDDAAIWARPTLELLAEGKLVFDDDWDHSSRLSKPSLKW